MSISEYGLDEYNVLFVTLDSCRFDTFYQANLPFISSIGKGVKALTKGAYTLPSHMSFFVGYLPTCIETTENLYYQEIRQLWRLRSGRERALSTVGLMLDGNNILEGYKKIGFKTIGCGGVRWFRNQMLTSLFDDFLFYGPSADATVFEARNKDCFVLNYVDEILSKIDSDRYFLFVNCLETHVPYDTGIKPNDPEVQNLIDKLSSVWGCKGDVEAISGVQKEDLKKMQNQQVIALEHIDDRLAKLCEKLPGKLLVVICGDHGECFGENGYWGHGMPFQPVVEVPLIIGVRNENHDFGCLP